jgi:predicted alpha/beta superfamily hydrolase
VIGERFTVHSEILGEDRTLLVATPDGYETAASARYPVLYLLDGDGHFHHATGVVDFLADNGRMPRVIVVGIPNPSQEARTRDLTPEHEAEFAFPGVRADSMLPTAGGADTFLRFLRDELAPLIDREYRTVPFRILVGHSFGGLFNIHALLADPEAFQAHIAISPSLWWDERRLVEQADAFFDDLAASLAEAAETAEGTETPEGDLAGAAPDGTADGASGPHAFLYMTMGNEGGAMLRGAWGLSGVLEEKAPSSFEWQFTRMEDEDHGSVPHRSLYEGLEWLYGDWALTAFETVAWPDEERLERIDEHFRSISERYGYEEPTPEQFLNAVGYALLGSGRSEAAISVFEANVERYPESPNVYDSLGDGYDAAGQDERALESYREAVRRAEAVGDSRLDTYRGNMERMLEKIGGA